MNTQRPALVLWSRTMRFMALAMALNLFMLPQLTTGQTILALCEESGSAPPSILEEEVVKHACTLRREIRTLVPPADDTVLLHQVELLMLEHPLLEVPHQPPKGA